MDTDAVLAAFDEQIRRNPDPAAPEAVERDDAVVRHVGDGWAGVTWTDLDEDTADAAIAAQVSRFSSAAQEWEWKYYSYDKPADLPQRLRAAGFAPEEDETLLVAEITDLDLEVALPDAVELVAVVDQEGIDALVRVHDEVFGGDHSGMGREVLARIRREPVGAVALVAMAEGAAICAGRVEFHVGTDFASLWGGGTLPHWRGRGVFRALVARRARLAADRGFRYLQVDASPDSRPILERLGFVTLATTTPYVYPHRD